jgi:hypothetical protein
MNGDEHGSPAAAAGDDPRESEATSGGMTALHTVGASIDGSPRDCEKLGTPEGEMRRGNPTPTILLMFLIASSAAAQEISVDEPLGGAFDPARALGVLQSSTGGGSERWCLSRARDSSQSR